MSSQSTSFQQPILKFTRRSLQWVHKHSLLTPQSTHERTLGHVTLPSGGSRGGSVLANSKRGKDYIFLKFSKLLVIMTNCACCVNVSTEPGSTLHVGI
jgi:hypothetical protein